MPKQKTIPKVKAEIAANERQLAQLRHKQHQIENRRSYYEKGDRRKRSTEICSRSLRPCMPTQKSSGPSITASMRYSMNRSVRTPLHGRKSRKLNTNSYTKSEGTYGTETQPFLWMTVLAV